MTPELAQLSRAIDPAALGRRIKDSRVAAGLTQQETAEGLVSTAYISRIEAGNRRPDLRLLQQLAERLDTSVEALLVGVRRTDLAEAEVQLDHAELALRSGDLDQALTQIRLLTAADLVTDDHHLATRGRLLLGLALEAAGRHDEAIGHLEQMASTMTHDTDWLRVLTALSRCYRATDELDRAVEVGARATDPVEASDLSGTDEAIQLAVAVATARLHRGDPTSLSEVQESLDRAGQQATPRARATAYWSASLSRTQQGDSITALPLARKAVELMTRSDDLRELARLKGELALLQARQVPPDLEGARASAAASLRDLTATGAGEDELIRVRLVTATIDLLAGAHDAALRTATACLVEATDSPTVAGEVELVIGRILQDQGLADRAGDAFRRAVRLLTSGIPDRRSGEALFELGSRLQELGDAGSALDAFRLAATSKGVLSDASLVESAATPEHAR